LNDAARSANAPPLAIILAITQGPARALGGIPNVDRALHQHAGRIAGTVEGCGASTVLVHLGYKTPPLILEQLRLADAPAN
jgi:hypothetical protein